MIGVIEFNFIWVRREYDPSSQCFALSCGMLAQLPIYKAISIIINQSTYIGGRL